MLLPREIDGPGYDASAMPDSPPSTALGMTTGLAHMEWFRRPDGTVAISEVGARPPGAQITTLLSYAHDIDFYRVWARLVVLEQFEAPERRYAVGCAYLRAQGDGRVRAVHGLPEVARDVEHLVVEARLPRVGQATSGTYEGEGYVILRHPDTAVVEQALARVITRPRGGDRMNVLMMSPGYPAEMPYFVRGLAEIGARVIGLGDQPPEALPRMTRARALAAYVRIGGFRDEDGMVREVRALAQHARIDRVECLWEPLHDRRGPDPRGARPARPDASPRRCRSATRRR